MIFLCGRGDPIGSIGEELNWSRSAVLAAWEGGQVQKEKSARSVERAIKLIRLEKDGRARHDWKGCCCCCSSSCPPRLSSASQKRVPGWRRRRSGFRQRELLGWLVTTMAEHFVFPPGCNWHCPCCYHSFNKKKKKKLDGAAPANQNGPVATDPIHVMT